MARCGHRIKACMCGYWLAHEKNISNKNGQCAQDQRHYKRHFGFTSFFFHSIWEAHKNNQYVQSQFTCVPRTWPNGLRSLTFVWAKRSCTQLYNCFHSSFRLRGDTKSIDAQRVQRTQKLISKSSGSAARMRRASGRTNARVRIARIVCVYFIIAFQRVSRLICRWREWSGESDRSGPFGSLQTRSLQNYTFFLANGIGLCVICQFHFPTHVAHSVAVIYNDDNFTDVDRTH